MNIDLRGCTIAITGASSGIGLATALLCAREGMHVVVAARREDRLRELVGRIEKGGGSAAWMTMDVTAPRDNQKLIDFAVSRFGGLYAVFSNAGYGIERRVLDYTTQELATIFETNFWSSLELCRLAARHMLAMNPAPHRGHILLCSSCVSKIGLPNFAAYSGSKALQDHFGRAMRIELAPEGIHVSTVHPIGTRTEFFDTARELSGGRRVSLQTPDTLKQPAETVAKAIVRCLHKPRGEVWTSFPVRAALALATLMPGLTDRILRRQQKDVSGSVPHK